MARRHHVHRQFLVQENDRHHRLKNALRCQTALPRKKKEFVLR